MRPLLSIFMFGDFGRYRMNAFGVLLAPVVCFRDPARGAHGGFAPARVAMPPKASGRMGMLAVLDVPPPPPGANDNIRGVA